MADPYAIMRNSGNNFVDLRSFRAWVCLEVEDPLPGSSQKWDQQTVTGRWAEVLNLWMNY